MHSSPSMYILYYTTLLYCDGYPGEIPTFLVSPSDIKQTMTDYRQLRAMDDSGDRFEVTTQPGHQTSDIYFVLGYVRQVV